MSKHEGPNMSFGFTYDVFLSFRGKDTRYTFVGHLRNELNRRGIHTFFDDRDIGIGQGISSSLHSAIHESKILMVVFSENYASSAWCLDELVKILDCSSRDNKQLVFPIFYHLDPSDLRKQEGLYAKHLNEHQNKFGKDSNKVKDWRSALLRASNLPGQHIVNGSNKYEIDFIEEIVGKVYNNIDPKPLHAGENLVGLDPCIEEVMSRLDMKSDDVRMLGIHGVRGIGKTELAKAVYDKIVQRFDAASFLENVREKSNRINGLEDLQKTLLSEMNEKLESELGSTSRGVSEIKRRLGQKKVLLVLDNVDDKSKLEKLAGGRDWFGKGSRIIITARDKEVLSALNPIEEMYEMKELSDQHSLELFCWNAFNQSEPKPGFEQVSLSAVHSAKRLPLALKVIGSNLAPEKTLNDWERVLTKYYVEKIHNPLNRFGPKPKKIIRDIGSFFTQQEKKCAKDIVCATNKIGALCKKSFQLR